MKKHIIFYSAFGESMASVSKYLCINKKINILNRLALFIGLIFAVSIVTGSFAFAYANRVVEKIVVEAGETFPDIDSFLIGKDKSAYFVTDINEIDLNQVKEYLVIINIGGEPYMSTLKVKDTILPKAEGVTKDVWLGEKVDPRSLVKNLEDETRVEIKYLSEPDISTLGEKKVNLVLTDEGGNKALISSFLNVKKDINPPVVALKEVHKYLGQKLDEFDFIKRFTDESSVKINFVARPDMTKIGEQEIALRFRDSGGNIVVAKTRLFLEEDTAPPVILEKEKLSIFEGESIDYNKGIEVLDNSGEIPNLSVDASAVNPYVAGRYKVIYTAVDKAGNVTDYKRDVLVKLKAHKYVDEGMLAIKATEVLKSIINDDMSDNQKIVSIYNWVKKSLVYKAETETDDEVLGAYYGIVKGEGDCFVYYSTTRFLLTLAQIDNVKVEKEGGGHYWNLVKCEGGYCHLDTTPFISGEEFILLTDNELKKISERNSGSHRYNKSLYSEILIK